MLSWILPFTSGLASTISGSYAIAANGYGNITVAGFGGGNVHNMQLYATDPTLNLNDPNNTQTDVGGALLLDVDAALAGGLGVAVAQTDTTSTDFSGNYAAGWQNFNDFIACTDCEFDMVANGTMTSGGAFSLPEAEVSDPFQTLAAGALVWARYIHRNPHTRPEPAQRWAPYNAVDRCGTRRSADVVNRRRNPIIRRGHVSGQCHRVVLA